MQDSEYGFIRLKVLQLAGVDLNYYKSTQMRRRLETFLQRSGYPSWPAFFRSIQGNSAAIDSFRNYLTINVSYFFRDPEKYAYLKERVLPELLRRPGSLRIWSAGCSRGHEPYSLAMLLAEQCGPHYGHQIVATDIDRAALDWAEAGGPYLAAEVAQLPPTLLRSYFAERDGSYWFTQQTLRRRISFEQHNLLGAAPRPSGHGLYDLIVCRNVVIYFTPEGKSQVYQHFYNALRPGGVLFVGGTEIISRPADVGFETLAMSFYRRA